jgi:hypothetical protein
MNGYLQRLAHGVLKPGGTIQPFIPSMFSPPEFANDPEISATETAEPATPAAPSSSTPPAATSPPLVHDPGARSSPAPETAAKSPTSFLEAPKSRPSPEPARTARHRSLDKPEAPAVHHFTPAFEPEQANPVSRRFFQPLVSRPAGNADTLAIPPGDVSHRVQREPGPDDPRIETTEEAPPRPLVDVRKREPAPGKVHTPSSTSPRSLGTDGKQNRGSRTVEQPRREPDEIQIHIGRIEVIAAPSSQARQTSPRPQRGPSALDEYLRRRDGKTT